VADRSGSIVIDVWKKSAAIPSVTETITGTEKPTLASQQLNNLTTLTTWTSTTVAAGDVISYNVDSVSSVQRVTLTLVVTK
jgi:hypothetical protein